MAGRSNKKRRDSSSSSSSSSDSSSESSSDSSSDSSRSRSRDRSKKQDRKKGGKDKARPAKKGPSSVSPPRLQESKSKDHVQEKGGDEKEGGDKVRAGARSQTPPPTKIHIGRLTRNVNREHLQEIFSTFGKIKDIEFGSERMRPW